MRTETKPGGCHLGPFSLDSGCAQTTRSLELNTLGSSSPPLMLSTSSSTSPLSGVCREMNKSSSSKACSCPDPESEVKSELNYLEHCLTPSLFPKIWAGTESEISPGHYISSSFTLGMKVLPLIVLPDFLRLALSVHPHAVPWSQDFKERLQVTRLLTNARVPCEIYKAGNGFRKWDFFQYMVFILSIFKP